MSLGLSVAQVAPLYNLGLVMILLILFLKLFSTQKKNRKAFLRPWGFIFFAALVYVTEEVLTVLRSKEIIDIPIHINGFFELVIIIMFIYAILIQKENIK